VFQHALDDAIGALPVLGNLFEVAGQHLDRFVNLGTGVLVKGSDAGRRGLLQLV
jgi:hypothetical protein